MLMIQFCTALLTLHIQLFKTLTQAFDQSQHTLFNLNLVLNPKKTRHMLYDSDDHGLHITTLTGHSTERVSE